MAANVEIANARVRPLGITVVAVDAAPDNVDQEPNGQRRRLLFPDDWFARSRTDSAASSSKSRIRVVQGGASTEGRNENFEVWRERHRARSWFSCVRVDALGHLNLRVSGHRSGYALAPHETTPGARPSAHRRRSRRRQAPGRESWDE